MKEKSSSAEIVRRLRDNELYVDACDEAAERIEELQARLEFLRHNLTCNDIVRLCGRMGTSFEDAIDTAIARQS